MNRDEGIQDLRALDPATEDPGYWAGFRTAVLSRAVGELARRRELARLTVPGLLSSWSRSLIPVSLAAAAIAAFMVSYERASESEAAPIALEELFLEETREGPFNAVMEGTMEVAPAAFLSMVEGEGR